jgi:hypothetical protein
MKTSKYPRPEKEPTVIEWAQAAAYLDSEGCITICRSKNTGSKRSQIYHAFLICISNTDMRLIDWLVKTFGGWVCDDRSRAIRLKKRVCYQWRVTRRDSRWFLEGIKPHLIMKTDQADLGLSYLNLLRPQGGSKQRLTNEDVQAREDIKTKLSLIKKQNQPLDYEQIA